MLIAGVITVTASEQRSQLRNREIALAKLAGLVAEGLAPAAAPRRATKPTRGSNRRAPGREGTAGRRRNGSDGGRPPSSTVVGLLAADPLEKACWIDGNRGAGTAPDPPFQAMTACAEYELPIFRR